MGENDRILATTDAYELNAWCTVTIWLKIPAMFLTWELPNYSKVHSRF